MNLIVPVFTFQVWLRKIVELLIRLVKLFAFCRSLHFFQNLKLEPNLPKMQLMACFIPRNMGMLYVPNWQLHAQS